MGWIVFMRAGPHYLRLVGFGIKLYDSTQIRNQEHLNALKLFTSNSSSFYPYFFVIVPLWLALISDVLHKYSPQFFALPQG
jgi:hypothetical protein